MKAIGAYILSIACAATLVGILQSFFKKGSVTQLLRLIGGMYLTFTLINPITEINFNKLFETHWDVPIQGTDAAAYGQDLAQAQLQSIIKQQCEAYILDKATAYHAQLEVEVTLSQNEMPIPTAVRLQGSVSPYAKTNLQQWIQQDLGISREQQIWIG